MLLIFQSRKTKLLAAELVSLPEMAAWLSTVIFVLSSPLNPLVNYLDPTTEHKYNVNCKGVSKNLFLWFYGNSYSSLCRPWKSQEWPAKKELLAPQSWQITEGNRGRRMQGMRGTEVFEYVVLRIRLNCEPKEEQGWKKKLSLLKLPNSVFSRIYPEHSWFSHVHR